jgi:hypothetical protein
MKSKSFVSIHLNATLIVIIRSFVSAQHLYGAGDPGDDQLFSSALLRLETLRIFRRLGADPSPAHAALCRKCGRSQP